MKLRLLMVMLVWFGSLVLNVSAITRYVDLNNPVPAWPYTDWASAATTIQDAVDAADVGDQILVTNGVYAIGSRVVSGLMANRVVVDKAVTVQSVNGPAVTLIQGYQVPGTTNGDAAVRCAYLADGAALIGFTLTNGATRTAGSFSQERSGGGVWCQSLSGTLSNCVLTGNSASSMGGGAIFGTLRDCILIANIAGSGGGARASTLINCTLIGNLAANGGGAENSTLNNCSVKTNRATSNGGGVYNGVLTNCTLTGNSAYAGGGANGAGLTRCTLTGNSATEGGGARSGSLTNCSVKNNTASTGGGTHSTAVFSSLVVSNSANSGGGVAGGTIRSSALTGNNANNGGAAYNATLINCTVTGNAGFGSAGNGCTLRNCILWYNGEPDVISCSVYSCCSPTLYGSGGINAEPQLASSSHLSANSPCRGAGDPAYATGTDIDGESWVNPPSMGCDEFQAGAAMGDLTVDIATAYTNVAPGFGVAVSGFIEGWVTASRWEFDDGTVVSNRPYGTAHAWSTAGDHVIVLRAYNDANPGGITATAIVHVVTEIRYVAVGNTSPVAPYNSWPTAATNIHDAIDAAMLPGALILVSNGVYRTGGRVVTGVLTNRLAVTKPVVIQSVNGPAVTVIEGYRVPGSLLDDAAVRCVYLTNGASVIGFTLTNGGTRPFYGLAEAESYGGGVSCASGEVVSNCVLTGNVAYLGGGASGGTLNNCMIISNTAAGNGGGVGNSTLNNCVLIGNSSPSGGGASGGTLNRCVLTHNSATSSGGGAHSSTLNNCVLSGNSATFGGGVHSGTLSNCTAMYNSATRGGGIHSSTVGNSIVYHNSAVMEANHSGGVFNYSCTAPLPVGGTGNIDGEPQLASATQLSATSPCRGAGNTAYTFGTDLDGEPWSNPPSMGCDEFYSGTRTGELSVKIMATYTNVATGFSVDLAAAINGALTASRWEFGDGTILSNRQQTSHAWFAPGNYPVVLRAYNDSNPGGVTATTRVQVVAQPVHYVAAGSTPPAWPYQSWATAATNIQDAVDAAQVPGSLILVSNGVYGSGGKIVYGAMTNRVAVTMPLILRSVNGPEATIIQGNQPVGDNAVRCVYLAGGSTLSGFTLIRGATRDNGDTEQERSGAGVWCSSFSAIISNCVLAGNAARFWGGAAYSGTLQACVLLTNSGGYYGGSSQEGGGGGAYAAILNSCAIRTNSTGGLGGGAANCAITNCTLEGNESWGSACGGAYSSVLNNCALVGNSATYGGGAQASTLDKCTLIGNSADSAGGGAYSCTLNNCLLTGNSSYDGGGGVASTFNYCVLTTNGGWFGGGAKGSTLNNCVLIGNTAGYGGGTDGSSLTSCTLVANRGSEQGGGARLGNMRNSIVYYNVSPSGSNYYSGALTLSYLTNCCTAPLPPIANGVSNFTQPPLFVDLPVGNLRLQSSSPCINAGRNAYVSTVTDMDGRPRIVGGAVDVGAYEVQPGINGQFIGWLQQNGLPVDGSSDFVDSDGEGMNNWQEWCADTVPTNATSALRMLSPAANPSGITVSWESVSTRSYWLERASNLALLPAFSIVATNISGVAGTKTYLDMTATNAKTFFYRVGVQ